MSNNDIKKHIKSIDIIINHFKSMCAQEEFEVDLDEHEKAKKTTTEIFIEEELEKCIDNIQQNAARICVNLKGAREHLEQIIVSNNDIKSLKIDLKKIQSK